MKERKSEERLEENQSKLWLCKYELNYGSSYDGKLQLEHFLHNQKIYFVLHTLP